MKCPYCGIQFHEQKSYSHMVEDNANNFHWGVAYQHCPNCNDFIVEIFKCGEWGIAPEFIRDLELIYPKNVVPRNCPTEVPSDIAEDFREACLVLPFSPKASAALSRRCLQNVLLDAAKVKAKDLAPQIQEVIDSKALPSHLSESIDAIRNIGNYAAHPNKCQHTGVIVKVEPEEAEWTLDVLELLFDFYYVQPAKAAAANSALNAKLAAMGKPPMKKP